MMVASESAVVVGGACGYCSIGMATCRHCGKTGDEFTINISTGLCGECYCRTASQLPEREVYAAVPKREGASSSLDDLTVSDRRIVLAHRRLRACVVVVVGWGTGLILLHNKGLGSSDVAVNCSFALGVSVLLLFWNLWVLAFGVYRRGRALGISLCSLLVLALPYVIYVVDRRVLRYLRTAGIRTRLSDMFRWFG